MRKVAIAIAALWVLGLLPAQAAQAAGKPSRVFLPALTGIDDQSCGYPIDVQVPVNNEYETTFFDQAGNPVRTIITGSLVGSFTNVQTDETIIRQTSGPAFTYFHQDGSATIVARGITALFLFPTDPGGPALLITSGPTTLQIDSNGTLTSVSLGRVVEDICTTLSG
jgi:hypothetical protein